MKLLSIAGKKDSGVASPFSLNNNGDVKAQRTWGIEEVTIFDALQIRETGANWASRISVGKYGTISLRISNTLDQPVVINIGSDFGDDNTTYQKNFGGANLGFVIPSGSGARMITPEEFPWLQYLQYAKLRASCDTAPTSGSVTIKLIGKY